jgi:CheY-like chemotaxis protein
MPYGAPWSDGLPFGRAAGALLVDPSPLLREALAGRLRAFGAREVEEAASLEEAQVRARISGPRALCLLEVDLPGSGPEHPGR